MWWGSTWREGMSCSLSLSLSALFVDIFVFVLFLCWLFLCCAHLPPQGFFIKPTIFADVEHGMKIHDEEIFGPVMSVIKFKVFFVQFSFGRRQATDLIVFRNRIWTMPSSRPTTPSSVLALLLCPMISPEPSKLLIRSGSVFSEKLLDFNLKLCGICDRLVLCG